MATPTTKSKTKRVARNLVTPTKSAAILHFKNNEIIGHDAIRSYFNHALTNHQLHHAHIFLGPTQIGKETVAWSIIQKILQTPDRAGTARHPDFYHLDAYQEDKTSAHIGIDDIRQLQQWLSRSAFHNGWKVALISDATQLSPESQNALLKTLEEPQPQTAIFLLTSSLDQLLPTIRSRCFVVQFYPVPTSTIHTALIGSGYDESTARRASQQANGRPGRALTLAADNPLPAAALLPTATERLKQAATITNYDQFQINRSSWNSYLHQCEAIIHERLRHPDMALNTYRQQTMSFAKLVTQSLRDNQPGVINPKYLNEYFHIFASL